MTEAILQGQAEKMWDLITASIENGFISHLGLDRKEASKMRGRNAVRIRTNEGIAESQKHRSDQKEVEQAVDGVSKKKRWQSRAGKHATQANRLINIARRMQARPSMAEASKKETNEKNNEDTLKAYLKEATILMKPSKDIEKQKDKDEERKNGGEKLLQEMLTLDLKNSIHAATCLRVDEKHKIIAAKWRDRAQAEDRRKAKEENVDLKKRAKTNCQTNQHSFSQLS